MSLCGVSRFRVSAGNGLHVGGGGGPYTARVGAAGRTGYRTRCVRGAHFPRAQVQSSCGRARASFRTWGTFV